MAVLNRPFKDSRGVRGWPDTRASFSFSGKKNKIRFTVVSPELLELEVPGVAKRFKVTKKNAIKLANWILSTRLLVDDE